MLPLKQDLRRLPEDERLEGGCRLVEGETMRNEVYKPQTGNNRSYQSRHIDPFLLGCLDTPGLFRGKF
jgi:hypothetical protein